MQQIQLHNSNIKSSSDKLSGHFHEDQLVMLRDIQVVVYSFCPTKADLVGAYVRGEGLLFRWLEVCHH